MKRILVACDSARMDVPLRRSLAHLVKSCAISIVHDGFAAFDEIGTHPFDLIVIDFLISGIDSLELAESVQFIDPGVPVILLVPEAHASVRNVAGSIKAQAMVCPFKPLKFLRLVDKLLHQQLNRYRQLAGSLETSLETLRDQTNTPCTFLVEENGQILVACSDVEDTLLQRLGNLAVGVSMLDEELGRLFTHDQKLNAAYRAQQDHGLYVMPVGHTLQLALLSPLTAGPHPSDAIWIPMSRAAVEIQTAFDRYSRIPADEGGGAEPEPVLRDHQFIPLSLEQGVAEPDIAPESQETFDSVEDREIAVNWEILSSQSNLLSRLQNLTRKE